VVYYLDSQNQAITLTNDYLLESRYGIQCLALLSFILIIIYSVLTTFPMIIIYAPSIHNQNNAIAYKYGSRISAITWLIASETVVWSSSTCYRDISIKFFNIWQFLDIATRSWWFKFEYFNVEHNEVCWCKSNCKKSLDLSIVCVQRKILEK